MTDFLCGTIVRLRPTSDLDAAQWLSWLNDPGLMGLLDRVDPVTAAQHARFYQTHVVENRSALWFAIERDGRFIGQVWLWQIEPRHRRAELRIMIGDRESWNLGAGSEAIGLMARYGLRHVGLNKVFAYVHARNERARGAFLKAGFFEEAHLIREAFWDGRFQDVWRLAIIAEPQM